MLSLCYLPTAGRLTLTIVKARNLKGMDITGKSGLYRMDQIFLLLLCIINSSSLQLFLLHLSSQVFLLFYCFTVLDF